MFYETTSTNHVKTRMITSTIHIIQSQQFQNCLKDSRITSTVLELFEGAHKKLSIISTVQTVLELDLIMVRFDLIQARWF